MVKNGNSEFFSDNFSQKDWYKFGLVRNGCSEFFLTIFPKETGTNLEQPKIVIPNLPVFLGKIVGKKFGMAILVVSNLYQSFWEKLPEKIWNGHFWPF